MSPIVERRVPDEPQRQAVLDLAARIEREDGAPPLSDQTRADLADPDVEHLIAIDDAHAVVGYAQVSGGVLEMAAEPEAVGPLRDHAHFDTAWTHGRHSRLVAEFERRGWRRTRELHQLRRSLDQLSADPPLPSDVHVRAFEPDRDDGAWLALNAAAFAHHPEQGRLSQRDLDARMAEPWFDAAGFLLAERDGDLVAFHWTKVHPDGLGEVYVLGVAPAAQGLGLGGALLVRGLRHLRDERHCTTASLYVDGDNPAALHLYERDGFHRHDLDVQWSAPDLA